MEMSLTLLPFTDGVDAAFTTLDLERREGLFQAIKSTLETFDVPKLFKSHMNRPPETSMRFGPTREDLWGNPLKYVSAEALWKFKDHAQVLDNWPNRAAWAYLLALPPDTRVALFWH